MSIFIPKYKNDLLNSEYHRNGNVHFSVFYAPCGIRVKILDRNIDF